MRAMPTIGGVQCVSQQQQALASAQGWASRGCGGELGALARVGVAHVMQLSAVVRRRDPRDGTADATMFAAICEY
jgi:hypothetical protein